MTLIYQKIGILLFNTLRFVCIFCLNLRILTLNSLLTRYHCVNTQRDTLYLSGDGFVLVDEREVRELVKLLVGPAIQ